MQANGNILEARGLRKSYGRRLVLNDVSLTIRAAERVALMGPSGSGKSTLLNCLGGVDRPDSGSIFLDGIPLEKENGNGLARIRREMTGTVFQFFHLLPTLSARENIELPMLLSGLARGARAQRLNELIESVGLAERAEALPSQLSGGEMQRVAIARALAPRPRIIFADEPTGNLDSKTGGAVLDLLERLAAEHRSALFLITHSEEATRICSRVLHIVDGALENSA